MSQTIAGKPEIQDLIDEIAKIKDELKKKTEIIEKQAKIVDILQRNALVSQNKIKNLSDSFEKHKDAIHDIHDELKIIKNAVSGAHETNLGFLKRILANAAKEPVDEFNIINALSLKQVWCVECLQKFAVAECRAYTGSSPICLKCRNMNKSDDMDPDNKSRDFSKFAIRKGTNHS